MVAGHEATHHIGDPLSIEQGGAESIRRPSLGQDRFERGSKAPAAFRRKPAQTLPIGVERNDRFERWLNVADRRGCIIKLHPERSGQVRGRILDDGPNLFIDLYEMKIVAVGDP